MSVVMEHSFSFNDRQYHPTDQLSILTFTTVIQFIKFGTITFFLLAGFLIGEKFTDYTPLQYFKRRVDSTIAPWLFWSLLFLALMILSDLFNMYRFGNGHIDPGFGETIWRYTTTVYLYSIYWFIPNFLICIAILLLFKRHLYSYGFGAVLLLFTTLYIINIYCKWIEPRHTTAVLGFVFFLWLGAQLNKNLVKVERWLDRIPILLWIILSAITLVAGVWEIEHLKSLHSVDPYNSLRLSNILYSICFFFLLLKIRHFPFTNFLKPRETTYGIFLIHYIIVYSFLPLIFPMFRLGINQLSYTEVWCYMLARFVIVYMITFTLVIFINKSNAKWLIGR